MTNYVEAPEAMIQRFNQVWAPTGHPYTLRNEVFDPPENSPWARVVVAHRGAPQKTLGRQGARKFERLGSLFIQVFIPQREGSNPSSQLVQLIVDAFEGQRIPGTTICFDEVIPREVGPSDQWDQVTIEAQFRYDETK